MSQLLYNAPAIKRLGIPAYNWWNEGLHGAARAGTATVFPQAIGLAAAFDEKGHQEIASIVSEEHRAIYNAASALGDRDIYKGLTVWSPNVNIFRDPRWGRGQETYGEDPYLTSRLGVSYIKGLQGDDKDVLKTASCVKHFAAHSGPEGIRHEFNTIVSKKDLNETYLPAFKAAVQEAGVNAVMGAYTRINGEPCCATDMLENLLRKEWGFDGMVISDCWAIRDFHEHHKVTKSPEESAALAVRKGCDLNCGCTFSYLERAYQKGLVSKEEITEACVRLFTTRFKLGLFDSGHEYEKIPYSVICSKKHAEKALDASRHALVLLRNNGILPLKKEELKSIAVIGPNANSRIALYGNYHGTGQNYVTVLEGIQRLCGDDVRVYYSVGCELTGLKTEELAEEGDRISEAITVAKLSDVTVLCLGLDETVEGEEKDDSNWGSAGDKSDLRLPLPQRELLAAIKETAKPIILLLLSGSALDPETETDALMQCWYPGERGGLAVAETLFGLNNPSGKLPVTFYKATEELPPFTDYSMKGRTYRYFKGEALYPFAYGLSYSRFVYKQAEAEVKEDKVELEVTVSNESSFDGIEITLAFATADDPSAPPNPFLAGFVRNEVKAGETKKISMVIRRADLSLVDDDGIRHPGQGTWRLVIGGHQGDERSKDLSGTDVLELEIEL